MSLIHSLVYVKNLFISHATILVILTYYKQTNVWSANIKHIESIVYSVLVVKDNCWMYFDQLRNDCEDFRRICQRQRRNWWTRPRSSRKSPPTGRRPSISVMTRSTRSDSVCLARCRRWPILNIDVLTCLYVFESALISPWVRFEYGMSNVYEDIKPFNLHQVN